MLLGPGEQRFQPSAVNVGCGARALTWVGMSILPLGDRGTFVSEPPFVLQRFTRAGIYSGHLKQAIDLKMELELALKKYEELNIEPGRGQRSRVSSWS